MILIKDIRKRDVPKESGIYIWKDEKFNILYVGKAKNLRDRIFQYLNGQINSYKTPNMLRRAKYLEFQLVSNNKEALLLENLLIKQHRPPYNILLMDDKRYPFIEIKLRDTKLIIKRSFIYRASKNASFYGPFPPSAGIKIILDLLQRECLYEKGLLIKSNDKALWKDKYDHAKMIMSSSNRSFINLLKKQMYEAAQDMQFELANEKKQAIIFLEQSHERQVVEIKTSDTFDSIVFKKVDNYLITNISYYRSGSFLNHEFFINEIKIDFTNNVYEIINQLYQSRQKPKFIYSNILLDNENIFFTVKTSQPKIGVYKQIIENQQKNIAHEQDLKLLEFKTKKNSINASLLFLKEVTGINSHEIKYIIIDNSHNANKDVVSAIMYYKNDFNIYSKNRFYNITSNEMGDTHYMSQGIKKYFSKNEPNVDLVIVDGSSGQINSTRMALNELGIEDVKIIGLVKDENHKTNFILNEDGEVIRFPSIEIYNYFANLQINIDNYAKNNYRKKNIKTSLQGFLTTIPGIGEKTEQKILDKFKNYANIYNASLEELETVVSKKVALKIKEYK